MSTLPNTLINVRSFTHPHIQSLFQEGLWGLPDNPTNRARWDALKPGSTILLYGEYQGKRGAWVLCTLTEKKVATHPVKYWDPPLGYPLLVYVKPKLPAQLNSLADLEGIRPLSREEMASAFEIKALRAHFDRWSIFSFGNPKVAGVTYSYPLFEEVMNEFLARNQLPVEPTKPNHNEVTELIYQIGLIQAKSPVKEYPIEQRRLDVVWRRTPKSVPYIAWEVCISGGSLFKDLVKLKHAYDLWNAIPVLVTVPELLSEARNWTEGYAHEIDVFRLMNWDQIVRFYEAKKRAKDYETDLGIL